jgi:DNA-binding NtrC family response regulator
MAYGFATQSGGTVRIHSEPGHGTVIKFFFPRILAHETGATPHLKQPVVPHGSETILVVEDDNMVRMYVEKQLKGLGYRVIIAPDAPAALQILRQPVKIDLLFTDVVMPGGLFGPELAEQATRLRPGLKVLLTTGYNEHPMVTRETGNPNFKILAKPFRRHDLAVMLRSVLG